MSHGTEDPNAPPKPEQTNEEPPQSGEEEEFRITPTWAFLGLVALALGLVAGLVMSSSWLR